MTLRLRLLLATFVLCLTTTLALGLGLRTAWLGAEQERFEQEFHAATADLEVALARASQEKQAELAPSCAHDPLVDSALVGLRAADLSSRVLSLRLRVPELARALGLDELALLTDRGEILAGEAAERSAAAGQEDPALARLAEARVRAPELRATGQAAFSVACKKAAGGRFVILLGAQRLDRYLTTAEQRYALQLRLLAADEPVPLANGELMQQALSSPTLGGRVLLASRSRLGLSDAVKNLDSSVVAISLAALTLALGVAVWLSQGLARPVVAFAERARLVVSGTPTPLPLEGGPELVQAARAFNQTLEDLSALKDRLAITERIAARREVARQIAHEIKNPLSPIRSAIETLRRLKARNSSEFDGYFDEATRTVLGEVARINELVRAFSEYASLPSPSPSSFDLAALVREVVQLHQGLGVALQLRTDGPVPLVADRSQITQILTNLIKNAIEATLGQAGNGDVEVTVRPADTLGLVSVTVSDHGPGVAEELRARLFQPYMTTKVGGTGLGLAISQRIAVEHGGDLQLERQSGPGASFKLLLPALGPRTSI